MASKSLEALESMVGSSHQTVADLTVEKGKVEEFARAIKNDNPAHRDEDAAREQGFDGIPAPLTFTRTSAFPRYRPEGELEGFFGFELGLDDEYVLHGEQRYRYQRPLLVGDTLTGETTLTDVYQREGRRGGTMTFVEFETAYYDDDDDLVLTETQVVVETAGAMDSDEEAGGET